MKSFSALYRNGYAENAIERIVLMEMNIANQGYEYGGTDGPICGNYLKDFLQNMGLRPITTIMFITGRGICTL